MEGDPSFNRRDGLYLGDAVAEREEAIQLDSGFARAHARLTSVQAITPAYGVRAAHHRPDPQAEEHAR